MISYNLMNDGESEARPILFSVADKRLKKLVANLFSNT